jgi:hypothetical protein
MLQAYGEQKFKVGSDDDGYAVRLKVPVHTFNTRLLTARSHAGSSQWRSGATEGSRVNGNGSPAHLPSLLAVGPRPQLKHYLAYCNDPEHGRKDDSPL